MKIYRDIKSAGEIKNPVLTTGTFDGVHIGHRQILKRLKEEAIKIGGESVVLTFWPHPRMVVFPDDHNLKLLNSLSEKAKLLEEFGIDHFIIYPFSKKFSRLTAEEYVKEILVDGVAVKKVAVGYDHRFGKNREGDFQQLEKFAAQYNFEVEEIPAEDVDNVNVSSTKIRKALENGEVDVAKSFLSYHYFILAKVIKGDGIGRTIGFPTANLYLEDSYKMIPKPGVYAVFASFNGKKYPGMMNIGFRPTLASNNPASLEVHLFDFNEDIYNQEVKISFVERLRDEKKFENIDALKEQLKKDKILCTQRLAALL